jgi:hypothetical protein
MDLSPAVVVVGAGIASVVVAMNVLVTAPPLAIDRSVEPTATYRSSFATFPLLLPPDSANPTDTPAPRASLPNHNPRFVHSVIKGADPGGAWSYYLNYPALIQGETPWAHEIDTDIRTDLGARADQWAAGPAAKRWARGRTNTLTGDFTTELVTPAVASWTLAFVDDSLPTGPVRAVETLNFDLATGQRLTLDDIFIDSDSAISVFSYAAPGLLRGALGTAYVQSIVDAGTSPLLSNYNNWAITRTGIKITFNQHQVNSDGPALPSIVVPWSTLQTAMNTTGPVAGLAGI